MSDDDPDPTPQETAVVDDHDPATATAEAVADNGSAPSGEPAKATKRLGIERSVTPLAPRETP